MLFFSLASLLVSCIEDEAPSGRLLLPAFDKATIKEVLGIGSIAEPVLGLGLGLALDLTALSRGVEPVFNISTFASDY